MLFRRCFDRLLEYLKKVFREARLKMGIKKSRFAAESCTFLGHQISKDGIHPPADRVDAVLNLPAPCTVKELRRIIGMFNWFKKFIIYHHQRMFF